MLDLLGDEICINCEGVGTIQKLTNKEQQFVDITCPECEGSGYTDKWEAL